MINKWTDNEKKLVWKCTTEGSTEKINVKNGSNPLQISQVSSRFRLENIKNKCKIYKKSKSNLANWESSNPSALKDTPQCRDKSLSYTLRSLTMAKQKIVLNSKTICMKLKFPPKLKCSSENRRIREREHKRRA
jgi:hypothetical protein